MDTNGELPDVRQEVHDEMKPFAEQTYWNKHKAALIGFITGAILSLTVTSQQFDNVRERLNSSAYDNSPTPGIGEVALAFSPMVVLPVAASAAYAYYRRRIYERRHSERVEKRIDKMVYEFGEELDRETPKV